MIQISIGAIQERDLDLLLLEEFCATAEFRSWFVSRAIGPHFDLGRCVTVQQSATHISGESDLEVTFVTSDNLRTRLLIENKINAGLQREQASRYHERGEDYVRRGICNAVHTIIVAPERYFRSKEGQKGFQSRVTYEEIYDWFSTRADLAERFSYKKSLLRSAIEKGTLGYQPVEDSATTEFWRAYWRLTLEYAPELEMVEPVAKPSGATFIAFRPPRLPEGVDIVHKFAAGYVDLQLRSLGSRLNALRIALESCMDDDMTLAKAAKSAAIRVHVPVLNPSISVKYQMHATRAGIETSKRLLEWAVEHKGKWSLPPA